MNISNIPTLNLYYIYVECEIIADVLISFNWKVDHSIVTTQLSSNPVV